MKVSELMTPEVEIVNPDDSVRTAAQIMADLDSGALPVCDSERLIGMITDRDITVRAVAAGSDPEGTPVREVMSSEVRYCFEDDDVEMIAKKMGDWQVRRLPVLDRDKRLVGFVSLGDLMIGGEPEKGREALERISQP